MPVKTPDSASTPASAPSGMSYSDYLHLDQVLSAQHPLSPDHNEMLFIVQHQTSELWFKLMLHELNGAIDHIRLAQLAPALKMLARVSKIFEQLVHAWDVLATMTPPEYSAIRPYLSGSSGLQSWQYRCVEFAVGNKNPAHLQHHANNAEVLEQMNRRLYTPSLYDVSLQLLSQRGFKSVPASRLQRDWSMPYERTDGVQEAWLSVYREPEKFWDLYQLAEELTDIEDAFRLWRFRHVTTVERVIGFKHGTGGTPGVSYLRKMLDVELFPELWSLRTSL
jgi:tryptophan 2,3-dioxygenase